MEHERLICLKDGDNKIELTTKTEKQKMKHMYDFAIDLWLLCKKYNVDMGSCGCCDGIRVNDVGKEGSKYSGLCNIYVSPEAISFESYWEEEVK